MSGTGREPPTSSSRVEEKVEWILYAGDEDYVDASEIFTSGYERDRGVRMLEDRANHPQTDETVQRRAQNAIEELTEDGGSDE